MKLTPEQLKQNAAAMIAFADGKPIERLGNDGNYYTAERGDYPDSERLLSSMARGNVFRPAPEPKTRPWQKPEDVPGPVCWIRFNNSKLGEQMIIGFRHTGFICIDESWESCVFLFSEAKEYSTDRKTWHPCTVAVE